MTMETLSYLFLLVFIFSSLWQLFLGINESSTIVSSEMLPFQKETTSIRKGYIQADLISQIFRSRKFLVWVFFVFYVTCCLYKIAFNYQSYFKWEYLKKCDVLRFLHRRMTVHVFCWDDYIRDRLNNTPQPELMKYEWARYESFKTYPDTAPHFPLALARNGFYYTGVRTFVRCFCCGRRFNTRHHEDMTEAHRQCTPACRFASGENSTDVPIRRDDSGSSPRTNGNNERSPAGKHPAYASETSRRSSYHNWPNTNASIETQLAEAGFFYAGAGDVVRCFSSGIGLRGWSRNDDPLKEHAFLSPQCQHVKRCKGEEFVRRNGNSLSVRHDASGNNPRTNGNNERLPAVKHPEYTSEMYRRSSYHNWPSTNEAIETQLAEAGFFILNGTSRQETQSLDDQMSRDLQSPAAQIVHHMGHSVARLKDAILHFRREHGAKELSAKVLVEYIHDTEPNILGPNPLSAALRALAIAPKNNTNNEDRQVRTSTKTVNEKGADQLQEEFDRLKHQIMCKVCLDKDACIVFLPCGHLVACKECAQRLTKCAVCRAQIQGTVKTYLS